MEAISVGFQALFSDPFALVFLVFGVFFGIVFGCVPGLTATLGVSLLIPFTFSMTAVQGLALLIGVYVGGISGGLITATLINIPGTPSSIFTCYDGYPMAKSGKPAEALSIGVFASLFGGIVSALALFLLSPPLAMVSLIFGSWEYFALSVLGLSVVITMASNDLLKGIIGALLGLIVGTIGLDAVSGASRLTFGSWQLQSGLQSTAFMMGLFAIREILIQSKDLHKEKKKIDTGKMRFLPPFKEMKGCVKSIILGCTIGTGIGILPGIGQNAATLIAYNQAKNLSKNPEKFGHGSPEGICASESSNNAVNGGALIPLITLGIPGDLTTAALIGGLMIQGLQPGPQLFRQNLDVVGSIMAAYFIANILMYFMELGLMRVFVRAVNVKFSILFPIILIFCLLGTFALNNRTFDIWVLLITGIFAYVLEQFDVSMVPVILGFILGPLIEKYYRMGMISEGGNFAAILSRPIAVVFLIVSLLFIVLPLCSSRLRKRKNALNEDIG